MPTKIGLFADKPQACTGFAIVTKSLAYELCKHSDLRVIYFGRFGQEKDFAKETSITDFPFEYVPCEGGVWDRETMVRIIKHYDLDVIFSEDDWFSAEGLCHGANFWNKPFHFLTPIDGLPIHPFAYDMFAHCDTVYVPNRSYQIINDHVAEIRKRRYVDKNKYLIKAEYLPHGVNSRVFRPVPKLREDKFTFVWIGRDDNRKALGRMIRAYELIKDKYDCNLLVRTDWNTPNSRRTNLYLKKRNIQIIKENLSNCPHGEIMKTYNRGHVLVNTSKAGGFELSTIEAMGCGLIALVTDWNFMNEQVINGKNGFKIPCSSKERASYGRIWGCVDVERLSKIMEWCLNNQAQVEFMGRWARNWVVENFKWTSAGKHLYSSIMKSLEDER